MKIDSWLGALRFDLKVDAPSFSSAGGYQYWIREISFPYLDSFDDLCQTLQAFHQTLYVGALLGLRRLFNRVGKLQTDCCQSGLYKSTRSSNLLLANFKEPNENYNHNLQWKLTKANIFSISASGQNQATEVQFLRTACFLSKQNQARKSKNKREREIAFKKSRLKWPTILKPPSN